MTAKTLFEKVWERHEVVPETPDTPAILYVDLHLTHEVTSPQAFSVLRSRGLKVPNTKPVCRLGVGYSVIHTRRPPLW